MSKPVVAPGLQFFGQGFNLLFPPTTVAGTPKVTDLFYKFTSSTFLAGGEYFTVNASQGDTMQMDIVDKDGVYSPAGTVLGSYLLAWQIPPINGVAAVLDTGLMAPIPPNVYLRVRYSANGTVNNVFFGCNLHTYLSMPT